MDETIKKIMEKDSHRKRIIEKYSKEVELIMGSPEMISENPLRLENDIIELYEYKKSSNESNYVHIYELLKDILKNSRYVEMINNMPTTPSYVNETQNGQLIIPFMVSFEKVTPLIESSYGIMEYLFDKIIFEQEVLHLNCLFSDRGTITFNKCEFKKETSFSYKINFPNEQIGCINSQVEDIKSYDTIFNGVDFSCLFIERCDFANTTFKGITNFEGLSTVWDKTKVYEDYDKEYRKGYERWECTFILCQFDKIRVCDLPLYGPRGNRNASLYDINFESCTIGELILTFSVLHHVSFQKTTIEKMADFKECSLIRCSFEKTTFKDEVDFKTSTFRNTIFRYTKFNGRGAFWGCYFENSPTFHNLILGTSSHLYFGEVNQIALEGREIKAIDFTLSDTIINGRLDFNNDNIKKLDMKGSVVAGTLSRVNFNPECANYETATIFKNEELKRNNIIKALEYQAKEKNLYMSDAFKNCRFGEFLSLLLSFIFHNHGQMWILALFWTICIWIGTFIGFENSFGILELDKYFVSDLIKYLSPTEYDLLTKAINCTESLSTQQWQGIALYMLGKIFVPYGIFEIVRAFRKLK